LMQEMSTGRKMKHFGVDLEMIIEGHGVFRTKLKVNHVCTIILQRTLAFICETH
jgi:hypothetical protein